MTDPIRAGGPGPTLQAFRETAERADSVQVTVDGQQMKVVAQGSLQGGAGTRSVAWVQGDTDSTRVFVDALRSSVGDGLSGAIARELGLEPAPGKALASRSVLQALEMAATGGHALAGVDFLTRLEFSGEARGAGFRAVLQELGLPDVLAPEQRAALDSRMQARFDAAAANGGSPVSAQAAATWLREELKAMGPAP